ncbi:hypothetical protein D1007_53735 [Hordeum vulgare]|nr:hypothetical protein D1007_53735 [Hordeum vulgare]
MWLVFAVLAVAVPVAARVAMPRRAYDTQVQLSLSLSAALAYLTLTSLIRRRACACCSTWTASSMTPRTCAWATPCSSSAPSTSSPASSSCSSPAPSTSSLVQLEMEYYGSAAGRAASSAVSAEAVR